jgi:hypothetical protein
MSHQGNTVSTDKLEKDTDRLKGLAISVGAVATPIYVAVDTFSSLPKQPKAILTLGLVAMALGLISVYFGDTFKYPRYGKRITNTLLALGMVLAISSYLVYYFTPVNMVRAFDVEVTANLTKQPKVTNNATGEVLPFIGRNVPLRLEIAKTKDVDWIELKEVKVIVEKFEAWDRGWSMNLAGPLNPPAINCKAYIWQDEKEAVATADHLTSPQIDTLLPTPILLYLGADKAGAYTIHCRATVASADRRGAVATRSVKVFVPPGVVLDDLPPAASPKD